MSRRRAALVTSGVAGVAVAAGLVGRGLLRRDGRAAPEAGEPLERLPPRDPGPVVSFDGTRLAVREAGRAAGPALLFVHGFSLDMTTWHYQWKSLGSRFRCVMMDLRSHGLSEPAAGGDLSLSAMGHDVAAVVEAAASGGPVIVVGHSMGGMAAVSAAEAGRGLFGSALAGVALVGVPVSPALRGAAGALGGFFRSGLGSVAGLPGRMARLPGELLARKADIGHLVTRFTQFGPGASSHLVSHVAGVAARAEPRIWTSGLASLVGTDIRRALGHVRVPVLVVVGDHDRIAPPPGAVELASLLPGSRLEVIEGAGHMPMLERHHRFNESLSAFAGDLLRRSGAGAGGTGARGAG